MIIRSAVALGFGMKTSIFDIDPHGQSHVGVFRQLFARRAGRGRAAKLEQRRVLPFHHLRAQFDFHRVPVACVRHKFPNRRRCLERREVLKIQRCDEAIGIHPHANSFRKNVAIHRHASDSSSRRAHNRIWNLRAPNPRTTAPCPRVHSSASTRSVGQGEACGIAAVQPAKTNGRLHLLIPVRISLERSFASPTNPSAAKHATCAFPTATDSMRRTARPSPVAPLTSSAARNGVASSINNQWPGGTERDSPAINQAPANHLWKTCLFQGRLQRCAQIRFRELRVESANGREKMERRTRHDFCQLPPIDTPRVDGLEILLSACTAQAACARASR